MVMWVRYFAIFCIFLSVYDAAATPLEVGGVKLNDTLELQGSKLLLNGAGVRYKAAAKQYAAGLYLDKKMDTVEQVFTNAGAKRVHLTMLHDMDFDDVGNIFSRGIHENVPKSEVVKLIPGLIALGKMFGEQKKLVPGDALTLDWIPGKGTQVSIKGVPQGEVLKEPEFFDALMRIWLGKNPVDGKLKSALLGQVTP